MNIAQLHELFLGCSGISTDTRNLIKDNLFFCLKGEHFNGNMFAEKAIQLGAKWVIYDDNNYQLENNKQAILVDNSLKTLQDLAHYHRQQFTIPVIGLTGSNGKTTTKELIKSVLSQTYQVHATPGNYNNHIGVPLTLLGITNTTEIALIEMGANHLHEIEELCEIAAPTIGYITNFGKAHLEGFGSIEGVIRGKSELYQFIAKHRGVTILNSDDQIQQREAKSDRKWCFGTSKEVDVQLNNQLNSAGFCSVHIGEKIIDSQLTGAYNFANINAAVALGIYFKLTLEMIADGISTYTPSNNRSQWIKTQHNDILLDAYNANPTSLSAAIDSFVTHQAQNKAIILGDMLELGNYANDEHKKIIHKVASQNFETVLLVGPLFKEANTYKNIRCFNNTTETKAHLKIESWKNKTVLIKGSRGIALEQLLDSL